MEFKNYPAEKLAIDSVASKLTLEENLFRLRLMDYTINTGSPFNVNNAAPPELQDDNVKETAQRLLDKNAIVMDGNGNINFIYPVSALPTHHQVYLQDGRQLNAMCAVDAMGTAFTFGQDVKIESKCSRCGELVYVQIRNGQIVEHSPEDVHVLHVDLSRTDNWAGSC